MWSFELERMTAADEGRLAQDVESLGFKALWIPESLGSKEVFAHAGILLAATKTLIVASGIANIWARDPVAMANGARTLAAERSLGAHPYFVPVEHTTIARRELGPDPLLAVEQACTLESDPQRARAVARRHMKRYLGLDNYANNLRRLGWTDADLGGEGSDALVDAIVAWGDVTAIRARADAHRANGADHVCLQVLGDDLAGQLRVIAGALL